MRVRMNLRQCVWVLAVVLGTGITGGTVRAAASPSSQDQAHDKLTRIIRKTKRTSKVCAKARMTVSITRTTPRRGTSKKTKTRKLTRLATSRVTRAINTIIDGHH